MKLSWLSSTDRPIDVTELNRVGVHYEQVDVSDDMQPALDKLKQARGYVEQDIIELTPETPNLGVLCDKFKDEHLHTDDEVRLVLGGEGVFEIRSADDTWMRVEVERGDLLVVPANCYHRFFLTPRKQIRCVRLFKDSSGWTPVYRETRV